jgi:hypothetical protein
VRDDDALRAAGRARRVGDVDGVVTADHGRPRNRPVPAGRPRDRD